MPRDHNPDNDGFWPFFFIFVIVPTVVLCAVAAVTLS